MEPSQFKPDGNYRGLDLSSHDFRGMDLNGASFDGANLNGALFDYADMRRASLQNATLRGASLHCTNLNKANLSKADLSQASLVRASLCRSKLDEAKLVHANLKCANLFAASLVKANMESALMKGVNFSYSNLTNAKLNHTDLTGAKLQRAKLYRASLNRSIMNRTNFRNANLQEAILTYCHLEQSLLERANLTGANLERTNLTGANLENVRLTESRLCYARLDRANLTGVNLDDADLSGAQLHNTILTYASLQRVKLAGAKFFRVSLKGANLSGLEMPEINLEESDLSFSNIEGSNLTKAHLCQANLLCANLKGVELNQANLERVNLIAADLTDAELEEVLLCGADLTACTMTRIKLDLSNLKGSTLFGVNLTEASLKNANLQRAYLSDSILRGSTLKNACLNQACLRGVNLKNSILSGADIQRADFEGASLPRNLPLNFLEDRGLIKDHFEDIENSYVQFKQSLKMLEDMVDRWSIKILDNSQDKYKKLIEEFKKNSDGFTDEINLFKISEQSQDKKETRNIINEIHEATKRLIVFTQTTYKIIKKVQSELLIIIEEEQKNLEIEGQSEYHEQLYSLENDNPFPPYEITCAIRAIESQRVNPLFDDSLALSIADPFCIEYIKEVDLDLINGQRPYISVRTKFFDNFLEGIFNGNSTISQVVILGSGMDTRAFRLGCLADKTIYELDKQEVINQKLIKLKKIKRSRSNHHLIPSDLTEFSLHLLEDKGYSKHLPSVWLLEGFLMYLSEKHVRQLFRNLQEIMAPGSHLGTDVINKKATLGRKELWLSGFDNPEELLDDQWNTTVIQPGEEGACFDRYNRKLPPREVADVERAFFITSQKS